ncbi:AhpC-TSA-domain-containing protein [Pluteus cervinus]|uniref:AhpC-TSA-domain-containing protein n=1 Tax=Pluteus cervinus TaxID=181527 RepID=A0ACD3BAP1_9AGAR|nr:AhpC-TSA-domain-containing protein [Pluteus cervinus]
MSTFGDLIGKEAPIVTLPDQDGTSYELKPGSKGVPTVVFFYPESGSFGCTKEACQFRDAVAEKVTFQQGKVEIVGVSVDPVQKQKDFVEKYKLNYPILSDEKGEAVKAYGVGKGMFGMVSVARVTFIIDKTGKVRDALDATMNYGKHAPFVAKWLDKLSGEDDGGAQEEVTNAEPQPAAGEALAATA